ncbi:alginate export family protein [Novosphingobium fuchskuhlense]|uniref:alginate export family protein n=1 Tax=Novosphingobium fuchskuhlense TaxID=1117702 RepID=UPI001F0AB474|nr:alginate export family protein [Novosphingobium fuchskuhlense]
MLRWGAGLVALFTAGQAAHAEDAEGFHLSGSLRVRAETIDGQPRVGFGDTDSLIGTRLRVLAEYRTKPVQLVAELFDSRVWGEDANTPLTTGEINTAELAQLHAVVDFGAALGKGSKLTVLAGRTMLNLGSRRLIASDDYRNTTQGYTGVKADLALPGRVTFMAMYMLPQVRLPDDRPGLVSQRIVWDRESFAQVLWGGMAGKTFGAGRGVTVEASAYHFGEHDTPGRPTRDRSLNTLGLRALVPPAPGRWDGEAEVMGQFGQTATTLAVGAPLVPVGASFVHLRLGYSFRGAWKPHLAFDFDRASGDGPGNRTYGRFDTLFGQRRADFAPAGLYTAINRGNLIAPGVKLEAAPSPRFDGFVYYRPMWLAEAADAFATTGVRDPSGRSGRFAGHQIDADVRWWALPKKLRLELCTTFLAKGRFLRSAPNSPGGHVTKYISANASVFF